MSIAASPASVRLASLSIIASSPRRLSILSGPPAYQPAPAAHLAILGRGPVNPRSSGPRIAPVCSQAALPMGDGDRKLLRPGVQITDGPQLAGSARLPTVA